MVLVVVAGLMAFQQISKEEFPEIALNGVSILITYPGVSPQEIEELITKPIEEEIADIEDIDNISSFSSEGRSLVTVEFTLEAGDIYRKLQEVQTEVDKVNDLPRDADDPEITETKHLFHLITVGVVGAGMEPQLKTIVDDMVCDFKKIYGVGEVEVMGARDREVWIEADPILLESYGLALGDIMRALKGKNLNMPGGTIKMEQHEIIVRTMGQVGAVREIENIIIRRSPDGGHVYVRDVARVVDTFEEPRLIARMNGHRSFNITVRKSAVGNIVDIVKEIKTVSGRYSDRLPIGAEIVFANDNSIFLQKRLNILYSNGLSGLLLVLVSLLLFIGVRPAVLTALGMPVAFCGTILLMNLFDITINSLSLFGMIVVLGMVVDDAIIVAENVYRYIEQGLPVREAALIGSQEVFWPVVASVATTIAAFMPMMMMTGPLGKFMGIIPQVVIFALAASLWEAFLILPSHLADFSRPVDSRNSQAAASAWFRALQDRYGRLLMLLLRRRYRTIVAIIGVGIVVLVTALGTLDVVLFPNQVFDTLQVKVELDPDMKIEQTELNCLAPEQILIDLPPEEKLSVESIIGLKTANLGLKEGGYEYAGNFAQMKVRMNDLRGSTRSGPEIMQDLRRRLSQLPGADSFRLEKEMAGPPVGKAVAVRVLGDDFTILRSLSRQVMEELGTIEGVVDIEDNFRQGKRELRLVVDEQKAALYDLDVEAVALAINHAYQGGTATEFKAPNSEIDVVVKFNEQMLRQPRSILDMKIPNVRGDMIPLKNVARAGYGRGYGKIRRYDERRVITVTANVTPGVATSSDVNREIRQRMLPLMQQYPDYLLTFGGEYEDTEKSMSSLAQSFVLALFFIYMIIASTFRSLLQPVILMCTIPLAVIGVFVGLIVMRTPIGMMSFMGIIALAGIVVNDSIVLISFINTCVERGGDRLEAIVEGARTRLRPVLLTSFTTILGLMPLALGVFGTESMLTPMTISIVWGLMFSSVLTLLLIPCLYAIIDDLTKGRRKAERVG
ncbi:MAG: efflux RND transporter permease subunit [Deltaproteobacteria bacterium]|nr:efflux RND transporter permease subunit [Deltaproteobacteria bacterium]